jgi:hypothetical protein
LTEDNGNKEGITTSAIAGLAIGIAFVGLFAFLFITGQQQSKTIGPYQSSGKLQSEQEFFRSNLKPGHSLYIETSFGTGDGNVSVSIANPTNDHAFQDCKVTQEIIRPISYEHFQQEQQANVDGKSADSGYISGDILPQVLNVTLKEYDRIPPHFVDYFETPIVPSSLLPSSSLTKENTTADTTDVIATNNTDATAASITTQYADVIGQSSWYIFECKKPYEAVAFPWITIGGNRVYNPGDTVHVKGIVGFSEVTIHVRNGNDLFLEKRIQTIREGGGIFDYAISIPPDAKKTWDVEVETPDSAILEIPFGVR